MNCQWLNKVYWDDWLKIIIKNKVMSRNKHMKIVADADTLTGIAAGIGRTSKRVTDFWSESYFHELCAVHGVVLASLAKKYLEDYEILPNYQKRLADSQQLFLSLESSAFFQREFHSSLMIWKRGLKKKFIQLL